MYVLVGHTLAYVRIQLRRIALLLGGYLANEYFIGTLDLQGRNIS